MNKNEYFLPVEMAPAATNRSEYFLPVLKETPASAKTASHRLMIRSGMVHMSAAGLYSWLPLGLRVLEKIQTVVRKEQQKAGAIPLLMPTIQPADLWKESGRYMDYGQEMLRFKDCRGRDLLYGPTNEEMITDIVRNTLKSPRDFPKNLYHIQWKFRDEVRPRHGVMRAREFLMKDGYSFDLDEASAMLSYQKMLLGYIRTFQNLGLQAIPVQAESGPIGGSLSHEFVVFSDIGESEVFLDKCILEREHIPEIDYRNEHRVEELFHIATQDYAKTKDTHNQEEYQDRVPQERRYHTKAIELGHVFHFGDRYSKPMNATVPGKSNTYLQMGSYGIGISRLVAAVIETNHDKKGIIWPRSIAPFQVGVVNITPDNDRTQAFCLGIVREAQKRGLQDDLFYDDTPHKPGAKYACMDLIGLPWRISVGLLEADQGKIQLYERATGEKQIMTIEEAFTRICS